MVMMPDVYLQTNDAAGNEVLAFSRAADGSLSPAGRYPSGGRGSGQRHLASAGSVVLSPDLRWLLVTNAGSNDLSLFEVTPDGLRLADRAESGGDNPTSVTVNGSLVYVLNNKSASISGFRVADGKLTGLPGSSRPLSDPGADPAQVSFTPDGTMLLVTERGTNSISRYLVDDRGYAGGLATIKSSGQTPYGLACTSSGTVLVTEAFGGAAGEAAASSYVIAGGDQLMLVTGTVGSTRTEVCWAVVTRDDRFTFVTNFGDGTISSYLVAADGQLSLRAAVAGSTGRAAKGLRDEALSADGRYLYAIDPDAGQLLSWAVNGEGQLSPVGGVNGMAATVAGLAAG
jgi:6-phosphogluconolactonase (cycloisomerase 2 family)